MTHWKFVFYLHSSQLQTSNFQFLQLGYINKNEKNPCSRCCCYSIPPPRGIRQFQQDISWSITWIFLLHCLFLNYVVSDHFRWSNVLVHQNKLKMCLHFHQILTWHRCFETRFLRVVHLCEVFESCSIRLSNDWNLFYAITDHLQWFRADKFRTSFKSEAFTFSSASVIEFIQTLTRNVARHRKVYAPFLFIAFTRIMIPFFRFSLKLRSFLSSPFFFRFSIMCRRAFNKTISSTRAWWIWNDHNQLGAHV